jgi:Transposase DDE domain group 1
VAELRELDLAGWPPGHEGDRPPRAPPPGAQLSLFDSEAGYRHKLLLTDQQGADIAGLELRHRGRARVENQIRTGKDTGMRSVPFGAFAHNEAGLELSLIPQDLLCQARSLCLDGELALAEPKRLRQRLLHVAGRIVRSGRRTILRLPRSWPWAEALLAAFRRLRSLPVPSPP